MRSQWPGSSLGSRNVGADTALEAALDEPERRARNAAALLSAPARSAHERAFADVVAARRRLGLEHHAPTSHLTGPSLLEPIAMEAVDAFNYTRMELDRLARQFPHAARAHRAVRSLSIAAGAYAAFSVRLLGDHDGPEYDVDAAAHERMHGPAAHEYGYFNYLARDNCQEAVEEYADAHILAGLELERRDSGLLTASDLSIARARDIAGALAVAAPRCATTCSPTPRGPSQPRPLHGRTHPMTTARTSDTIANAIAATDEVELPSSAASTEEGLSEFLGRLRRFRVLTKTEEQYLAQRIERGDLAAKNKMVEHNLRLVVSIAKGYRHRGLSFMEPIQEGTLGLVRAVEKFDYRKDYKFSTYATWWVRQSITRALADKSRIIRLPANLVEQLHKIRHAEKALVTELGRPPRIEEIAAVLEMDPQEVMVSGAPTRRTPR